MPTTNYNFTTINGTDPIDIVSAINIPLQQIDTKLKEIADSIQTIDLVKGATYDDLKNNGFLYEGEEV